MKGGRWATAVVLVVGFAAMLAVLVAVALPSTTVRALAGPVGLRAVLVADEPRRSVGPMAGGGGDAIDPVAVAAVDVDARSGPWPPNGCRWDPADRGLAGPDRDRRVVALGYCVLLGRSPDAEGGEYWAAQLAGGLPPAALARELSLSPEYLAPRTNRDPAITAPVDAIGLLVPAGVAPAAATASDDSLRVRRPIGADAFEAWVAERAATGGGLAATTTVEAITPSLTHLTIVGDGQEINAAYVHRSPTRPEQVSPGRRGRAVVGSWGAEVGADVAVNGNWYGPWDGPAVSDGEVYGGTDHFYTALLGFTVGGDVVVEHHREVNESVDPRVVDGVSGHPTLVHRGDRTIEFGTDPTFLNRHPRTAVGIDRSGDVLILVTVDGRSRRAAGMTGDETARLMEALGAHDAVMLDGGGSSTMWIAGRGVVNRPSGGLRAVGNELVAFGS